MGVIVRVCFIGMCGKTWGDNLVECLADDTAPQKNHWRGEHRTEMSNPAETPQVFYAFVVTLSNLTIIVFCGLSLAQRRKSVSAYVCVYICTRMHIYTYMYVCVHTQICTYKRTCKRMFVSALLQQYNQMPINRRRDQCIVECPYTVDYYIAIGIN